MKNTKQITGRRPLRFHSLDEIVADAETLASGPIQPLGNWSAGQVFDHLARSFSVPLSGVILPIPWYIRCGARLLKPYILRAKMSAGIRLDGESAAAMLPQPISTEQGLAHLREVIARWKVKTTLPVHSIFGSLTDEEWIQLQLRHAELHLSFLTRG